MTLKLKFDSKLPYQLEAINSIVNIFEGQSILDTNFELKMAKMKGQLMDVMSVGNNLTISDEEILKNVKEIQDRNDLEISKSLKTTNFLIDTENEKKELKIFNFSIEMETGTGKTYVYLRTIFELNKKYGLKKFIIVVPSIAIKEGVLKSIEITKKHFQDLYDKTPFDYFVYDPKNITNISKFAQSNNIQILIINIDAFRKTVENVDDESKANIIHREQDKLQGRKPIEFIKSVNPIVIIDEPQSVDTTEKAKQAISTLNPLCTLRYSATHRELYNLMYNLDPIKAYDQRLVKKIQVTSVLEEITGSKAYVKLIKVDNKKGIKAKISIHSISKKGVEEIKIDVKDGDDVYEKSGNNDLYKNGYVISVIDCTPGDEHIEFTNSLRVNLGEGLGGNSDELQKSQIKATIKQHLDNELKLLKQGIKVLSLFFIDRVANYRDYNDKGAIKGKFAQWFEESFINLINLPQYKELKKDFYGDLKQYSIEKIHDGYFSKDKAGHWKDTGGESSADDEIYDLIMKNKEKLLSLNEPLKFIFSHSALREGWDNPNVFQICTLNDTKSAMKKRQEIGRGLRLSVNQEGERIYDEYINKLTVVVNESYENFVKTLQSEFEADGIEFGKVQSIAFKKIEIIDYKGNKPIGSEKSEEIYKNLIEEGYLTNEGKITQKFTPEQKDFVLKLKPEFEQFRPRITDIIKNHLLKNRIENTKEKKQKILNKEVYLSEDFKELWNRISQKTLYSVDYKSNELIKNVIIRFKDESRILPPKIKTSTSVVSIDKKGVDATVIREESKEYQDNYYLPNILTLIDKELEYKITKNTISEIIIKSGRIEELKINPQEFMRQLTKVIKNELNKIIVQGIKYEKIENEYYLMQKFHEDDLKDYLISKAIESKKHIFNIVEYDSETEKTFAQSLNNREDIILFTKLPGWFIVKTPLGDYNPDWAIVKQETNGEKLYLVKETKGSLDYAQLRSIEDQKIQCGKKHFESIGVDFGVASNANQI